MSPKDDDVRETVLGFAQAMAAFWQERLGVRLLGLYLLGSLAHGGFNRRYSDIDMGLVAEGGLDQPDLDAMRAYAAGASATLAPRLSLFWTDRRFSVGRFPPLDRADFLDHGVPLIECERIRPVRPTLEQVRAYLAGTPLENWGTAAARFAVMVALDPKDHKPYVRAHLYPARFVYSWMTGRMASNDEAVAFVAATPPDGLDVTLVERALEIRHAAADPDPLFGDRSALPRQVGACARLARR